MNRSLFVLQCLASLLPSGALAEPGMFLCRSPVVANDFWTDFNQAAGAASEAEHGHRAQQTAKWLSRMARPAHTPVATQLAFCHAGSCERGPDLGEGNGVRD